MCLSFVSYLYCTVHLVWQIIVGEILEQLHNTSAQTRWVTDGESDVETGVDLALAADVLIYIRDIEPLFRKLSQPLRARDQSSGQPQSAQPFGGLFVFTIEELFDTEKDGDGGVISSRLESSGRYSQSRSYIDHLARQYKFRILAVKSIRLRKSSSTAGEASNNDEGVGGDGGQSTQSGVLYCLERVAL